MDRMLCIIVIWACVPPVTGSFPVTNKRTRSFCLYHRMSACCQEAPKMSPKLRGSFETGNTLQIRKPPKPPFQTTRKSKTDYFLAYNMRVFCDAHKQYMLRRLTDEPLQRTKICPCIRAPRSCRQALQWLLRESLTAQRDWT